MILYPRERNIYTFIKQLSYTNVPYTSVNISEKKITD